MIEIENLVTPSTEQFEIVIWGMRNAFKSYDRTDSETYIANEFIKEECYVCSHAKHRKDKCAVCGYNIMGFAPVFDLGRNDKRLAQQLIAGDDPSHRKFLRQLPVLMDIRAPLYFLKQLDTYKVGTTASSESTMHTLTKYPFEMKDFSFDHIEATNELEAYIDSLNELRDKFIDTKDKKYWYILNEILPQSYMQKRTWSANYEVLMTIIAQRIQHKLPEWRVLIAYWLEHIPYLADFCNAAGIELNSWLESCEVNT